MDCQNTGSVPGPSLPETDRPVASTENASPQPGDDRGDRVSPAKTSGTLPGPAGGPASTGGPSSVGQPTGQLGSTLVADAIPFSTVGDSVRSILQRTAPHTANIVFENINRLKNVATQAEYTGDFDACIKASQASGTLALKTLELTVGKQVNVSGTIRSQADIPQWDRIPVHVRQRYLEALEHATVVEGEAVPQTDEEYFKPPTEHDDPPAVDEHPDE